jgi:heme exporter protein D
MSRPSTCSSGSVPLEPATVTIWFSASSAPTTIHALPLQLLDHRRAVLQQADARRERHARTQPRRGHRLVGTLAAQAGTEALAAQRLARLRQPWRMHDEVAVDAAEHEDLRGGGHRRSGSPK